jgi:luciferase family oxidoreductase group 1
VLKITNAAPGSGILSEYKLALATSNVGRRVSSSLERMRQENPGMPTTSRLSKTPLSILDLAHLRQGGTLADAFHNTLDLARHAEQWGYKRFWLAEHHNVRGVACSATSVLIGYVASATSRIRVGSGGIMLPNHAPLVIAEQFGTLEALYPGRIDLGLGRAPGGDFAVTRALRRDLGSNGENFPELLQELRGYLAPAKPKQEVRAIPGAGTNIPIWLLGSSNFSAQLASMLGLPFAFAGHFQPDGMTQALELYRRNFRPSEVLERPYSMAGVPVMVAETDEQAKYLASTPQQMFLNLIRGIPGPLVPPVERMDWNAFEEATVRAKFRAAIVGSPHTVREKLEAFLKETQVDELMVVSNPFEHADRLKSYELLAGIAGTGQRLEVISEAVRS